MRPLLRRSRLLRPWLAFFAWRSRMQWWCNAKHRSFCAANAYDHRRLAAKRQVERIPFVERLNNIEKFIPNRALPPRVHCIGERRHVDST